MCGVLGIHSGTSQVEFDLLIEKKEEANLYNPISTESLHFIIFLCLSRKIIDCFNKHGY